MLCALNPEEVVPADHPLRAIKALADSALGELDADLEAMYIREVLRRTRGHKSRAADILGINRKTLLEKRRRYGIS